MPNGCGDPSGTDCKGKNVGTAPRDACKVKPKEKAADRGQPSNN